MNVACLFVRNGAVCGEPATLLAQGLGGWWPCCETCAADAPEDETARMPEPEPEA